MIGMVVATMVAFDAAEYVTFTTIGRQFKNSKLKGANPTMNVQDFIRQAKAKQSQGISTAVSTVNKVKEVVTGMLPVSQNALDARTVNILTLIAAAEQRIDNIEEAFGAPEVAPDLQAIVARVTVLMENIAQPKKAAPVAKAVEQETAAVSVVKEEVQTVVPAANKRKVFDIPVRWDEVVISK